MMAEERKEMVSFLFNISYFTFILGILRETFAIKKQADK